MNFRVILVTVLVAIPALVVSYHEFSGDIFRIATDLVRQNIVTVILSTYAFANSLPFLKGRKARRSEREKIESAADSYTGRGVWSYGILCAAILAVSNLVLGALTGIASGMVQNSLVKDFGISANVNQILTMLTGPYGLLVLLPVLCVLAFFLGRSIFLNARKHPLLTALVAAIGYLLFKIGDTAVLVSMTGDALWHGHEGDTAYLIGLILGVVGGVASIPLFLFVGIGVTAVLANRWDYEILERVRRLGRDQKLTALKQVTGLLATGGAPPAPQTEPEHSEAQPAPT